MAFDFGQVSEFSDANSQGNPVIAALGKVIQLPRFKGVVYEMMGAPMVPISQKQFDIYSRTKTTRNGVIGTAGSGTDWNSTSDTSALPLPAGAIAGLTIGHVLKVDNEVMVVSAVDRAANTIDVFARGAGGTTAATHATGAAFTVLGVAGRDVDLKNVSGVSEGTKKYSNYVQTLFELLDWQKGAELERQGMEADNIIFVLRKEAALRVAATLSTMALLGVKQSGTSSIPYMSAGLLSQLADTNGGERSPITYGAAGAITETKLRAALKTVFQTGNPSKIILSGANKEVINGFNGAGKDVTIQTDRADTGAGRTVNYYDYEGARLDIVVDADMPDSQIAIVSPGNIKKGWLRGDELRTMAEPTQSSREKRESIQGSVGFIVEDVGLAHCLITGVTV